jgi:hypothetical protein
MSNEKLFQRSHPTTPTQKKEKKREEKERETLQQFAAHCSKTDHKDLRIRRQRV